MENREIALWGPAALSGEGGGKGVPLANPPDPINRGWGGSYYIIDIIG
jgi:hypothetical protein